MGFQWRIKATNAIYLQDKNGEEGRPFKARFLQAGLVKYDFGVCLLKKETIDKFVNTFIGTPLIIDHKDNLTEADRVGTINNIWFSAEDGWFWCDGIIADETAVELIEKGYNVSCQYRITDFSNNTEGKLHNANPYDKEILDGVFEHLAIVENPRYEDAFIAVNAYIATNDTVDANGMKHSEKNGQFTGNVKSSFYNPETKTIELKGNELGSNDDEIRENGLKYFKENYQGKKFDNPKLNGVLFSNPGIKKFMTNSADIHKIKAIPALKDIIEKGEYQGAEDLDHPREGGIIKFHRINHNVSIDGEKENMSVLIGEDKNGNRFYNLNNRTYKAENSSRGDHAIGEANEEFSINIIAYNSSDFNPIVTINKETNYDKVFDYIRNTKGESMDNETKGLLAKLTEALSARNEAEKDKDEKACNEDVDKRKLIDEVGGILKGKVDEEVWRTVIGKIEKAAYDKSEAGTADNKAKNEDDEDKKEKKASNEEVDKRDLIRQIMAIAGKHEDNEDVRTIAKLAEKLAYDKSEAGTADNKAKNKCKNDEDEELYEELKEKTEKAAENKAKNSLDDIVNGLYATAMADTKPAYISPKKGIELGEQIYGAK